MGFTCIVGLLLLVAMTVQCTQPLQTKESFAQKYLSKYGYLASTKSGIFTSKSVDSALKEFQESAGLQVTGVLDEASLQVMSLPRCGVVDKKYLAGSRWSTKSLTYKITRYTPDMHEFAVNLEIARAFRAWSRVSQLSFRQVTSGAANISIVFEPVGDGYTFDGPGGVLAYAFGPEHGGTHFDDAETWTMRVDRGTNLFQVALHEFGHALGLGHTDVAGSIMVSYYSGYNPNAGLGPDDIAGIQSLYGAHVG